MKRERLTILVSGMIAGVPFQGGAAWAVLQYVLGFKRLGHQVYFVEPVSNASPQPMGAPFAGSANADYFCEVMQEFGLENHSAFLREDTRETVGLSYRQLHETARRSDLLINASGMLTLEDILEHIPTRVYLDLDPAFNQLWHATQGIDMRFGAHSHFVTVGLNLGHPDCPVPLCGLNWITTLQPIVLEQWEPGDAIRYDALTTVANWRGYGSITADDVFYGQKAHSLRKFMDLPRRTSESFMLALAIHPDEKNDLETLGGNGWHLLDPARVTRTPARYREFIRGSKAEFGIAKQGYVTARSGWFSDRSVCYLASGRPVLAQETQFSRFLPTGDGLFAFETGDDVLRHIQTLNQDYAHHARAAHALAHECFDSDTVLARLLDCIRVSV
jgi:hypothetical protein